MGVWHNRWSLEGNYFYGSAGKIPAEEFESAEFLVIDNMDRLNGLEAQSYRNMVADRHDNNMITIVVMQDESWLDKAPMYARFEDIRKLYFV